MSPLNVASAQADRKPTRPRLPRYVNLFTDRHGQQRCYFRRNGVRIALSSDIGSPAWWKEYAAALGGQPPEPPKPTSPRVRPGTIDALIEVMLGAAAFREDLGKSTRRAYLRPVAVLRELIGDWPVAKLTNADFRMIVESEWRQSLGTGNAMLVCVRRLQKIAQAQGHPALDWCIGLNKRYAADRSGHHIWTLDEVLAYRAAHPLGSLARLVFELAIGTGLRRKDLTKVGRQHVSGDKIRIVAGKTERRTGKMAVAVITPDLQAVLDLVPHDRLTFIVGPGGEPVTDNHLGYLFQGWCREAGLPARCTLHGIRKHLGSTLASRGAGPYEVGAVLAISDPKTIAVYTRGRDADALAERAFARLETPDEQILANPVFGLSKGRSK